jgi:hypothetical protein
MDFLALPVVAAISFLTALVFGLAAQRLLGIRLGLVRLLIAGVFALFVNWPIQAALLGDYAQREPTRAEVVPVLFFVLLAMACTVLASMAFLVVIEAFFPLGSLPPPLVWGRGLRARLARARRYWQIVGVALRHGLGPFLRDTRRRDDGAGRDRQLGRALRKTLDAGGVTFVKLGQVLSTRRDLHGRATARHGRRPDGHRGRQPVCAVRIQPARRERRPGSPRPGRDLPPQLMVDRRGAEQASSTAPEPVGARGQIHLRMMFPCPSLNELVTRMIRSTSIQKVGTTPRVTKNSTSIATAEPILPA